MLALQESSQRLAIAMVSYRNAERNYVIDES